MITAISEDPQSFKVSFVAIVVSCIAAGQLRFLLYFSGSLVISNMLQGKVVVIRGEGPKGGPGMPEMLTPTSAIMGAGLGKVL